MASPGRIFIVVPIFSRAHYGARRQGGQSPPGVISRRIFLTPNGGKGQGPPLGAGPGWSYFSWNVTVTVKMTGRGRPLMIMGS